MGVFHEIIYFDSCKVKDIEASREEIECDSLDNLLALEIPNIDVLKSLDIAEVYFRICIPWSKLC
jgi:hypothetical protein